MIKSANCCRRFWKDSCATCSDVGKPTLSCCVPTPTADSPTLSGPTVKGQIQIRGRPIHRPGRMAPVAAPADPSPPGGGGVPGSLLWFRATHLCDQSRPGLHRQGLLIGRRLRSGSSTGHSAVVEPGTPGRLARSRQERPTIIRTLSDQASVCVRCRRGRGWSGREAVRPGVRCRMASVCVRCRRGRGWSGREAVRPGVRCRMASVCVRCRRGRGWSGREAVRPGVRCRMASVCVRCRRGRGWSGLGLTVRGRALLRRAETLAGFRRTLGVGNASR